MTERAKPCEAKTDSTFGIPGDLMTFRNLE